MTITICLMALMVFPLKTSAQDESVPADSVAARWGVFNRWYSPEKLYVHLDRTCYAIGETIWFSAYLENASSACEKPLSNFIYVELLGSEGNCILREKVKANDCRIGGVKCFAGQMLVDDGIPTGRYIFRAYTRWQLNREPEYLFNQPITIKGEGKMKAAEKGEARIDVSFYPEGGVYFADNDAVLGFKIMDDRGRSVNACGHLVDDKGNGVLANVSTQHDGMGRINFRPVSGADYYFELDGIGRFKLPAPALSGASIHVANMSNAVYATVTTRNLNGSLALYLRDAGSIRMISQITGGQSASVQTVIQAKHLNSGINHLILADAAGRIVSERLFYVYPRSNDKFQASLSFEKDSYGKRERIRSIFNLNDGAGKPVDGIFSVSVVRGGLGAYTQNDDIVSYLDLSSELKGRINEPGWYFNDEIPLMERRNNLDLLMLVQGWRYYDAGRIFSLPAQGADDNGDGLNRYFGLKYSRELTQSISGTVKGSFGKKRTKNYDLNILIPSQNAVKSVYVDKGTTFFIDSLDFTKNTGFIVSSVKKRGIDAYVPLWDGDVFAQPFIYSLKTDASANGNGDENAPEIVPNDAFGNDVIMDSLVATVVTARKDDEMFVGSGFGIDNRMQSFAKTYEDRTLVEYLLAVVPSFHYSYAHHRLINRNFSLPMEHTLGGTVTIIVNGIRSESFSDEIEYLNLKDVTIKEISTKPTPMYPYMAGYVSIEVSNSKLHITGTKDPSMTYFVPLGYQEPEKFYSPMYDSQSVSNGNDCRNTIYWSPAVELSNGGARINFSNTDQLDYPYVIRIEGVSSEGKPFSWHGVLE